MTADPEANGNPAINDEMLAELREQASVLSALDKAEDIALDLHERPFHDGTRQRALQWLQSPQYDAALRQMRSLGAPTATEVD